MNPTSKMLLILAQATIVLAFYAPASNSALSLGVTSRRSLIAEPHISNGYDINIKQVPYQVSVENLKIHVCGGAIVSDDIILTAAHCLLPQTFDRFNGRLRTGATRKYPIMGWDGSVHDINFFNSHPKFALMTCDFDVGVIRLATKLKFDSKIQPIAIPAQTEDAIIDYSKTVLVTGYGFLKEDDTERPSHLKAAQLPLIPRDRCRALVPTDMARPVITARMICGGFIGKAQVDLNRGDSGGPVVQDGKLIGVVSFHMRVFSRGLPAVFTNLLDEEVRSFYRKYMKA